jgi:hypothetical protein
VVVVVVSNEKVGLRLGKNMGGRNGGLMCNVSTECRILFSLNN